MTAARVQDASQRTRRLRLTAGLVQLAPLALVVIAEAAWISVVAGLLQEFALRDALLGIPAMAVFVVIGIVLARTLGPRLGDRWPGVAFGIVMVGAVGGMLAAAAARDALANGVMPALAAHPGGLLVGLAILRGFAHAGLPLAEDSVTHLLAIGIPGLAIAATLGGVIGEPFRSRFLADAFVAAIVFVGSSVLALAFTRIDAIGADSGFDWRRNPSWLLLAVAVMLVAILVALPIASVVGTFIAVTISLALGPMLLIGIVSGFDKTARRTFGIFIAVLAVFYVLIRLFGSEAEPPPPPPPANPGLQQPPFSALEQIMTVSLGGLLLLVTIVAVIVLVAIWMRRMPPDEGPVGETRTIDPSGDGIGGRLRRRRFGIRARPTTAVQAYVALVDDLERQADIRRDPAETPARHAARLRSTGRADLSLDLLAADYALARYGGIELPAREDRRAVGRWKALRRRLLIRPESMTARAGKDGSSPPPTPDAELPVDLDPRRTL